MKLYKYIVVIVILIITLIVVHFAFLIPAPFSWLQANWTADGILAYLGAIVTASCTIFVFVETLKYNRKKDIEDKKFQIKPCLFTTKDLIVSPNEKKELNEEAVIINIDENNYCTKTTLKEYQKKYFSLDSRDRSKVIGRQNNYYDIKYCVTNVGIGSALDITLKIDDKHAYSSLALQVNKHINFIISINRGELNVTKDYIKIEFTYSDASFKCKYIQKEVIRFFTNHKYGITSSSDNELTPPKETII